MTWKWFESDFEIIFENDWKNDLKMIRNYFKSNQIKSFENSNIFKSNQIKSFEYSKNIKSNQIK